VVNGESGLAIESVMIGGRWVLQDRRMRTVDESRLRGRVAEAVRRLDAGRAGRPDLPRRLEPFLAAFCRAQAHAPGAIAPPWSPPPG
jgi:hypothetical protein